MLLLLRQEENDERPRGWRPADARRAAGKSGSAGGKADPPTEARDERTGCCCCCCDDATGRGKKWVWG